MGSDLQFHHVSAGTGEGAALVAAVVAEMRDLCDGLDFEGENMPKAGAAELGPPGGTYLVDYRDGRPVCWGRDQAAARRRGLD